MKQIIGEWLRDLTTPSGYLGILFGLLLALLLVSVYRLVRTGYNQVRIRSLKNKFLKKTRSYKDSPDKFALEGEIDFVWQRLLDLYEELCGMTIGELYRLKKPNSYQLRIKTKVERYYDQLNEIKKSVDIHMDEGIPPVEN